MSNIIHTFMRPQPPTYQPQPERKPKRSLVRTAAIAAGGAGLAYGGVQVGRAASQVRKAAAVAEDAAKKGAEAAENARVITGKIRKAGRIVTAPVRAVKRVLRFDAAPGKPNVARDRYVKQIKDADLDRAEGHYLRSGAAGALLGLALRKGSTRKMAALKGVLGGIAAQGAVRAVTEGTKDSFGDRSHGAKTADRLPAPALAAAALVAGTPRARATVKRGVRTIPRVARTVGRKIVGFNARRALAHGAALAGGITTADILTGAIVPDDGHTRAETAKKGLVKGAIYGTTLAAAEPAILGALKRVAKARSKVELAARGRTIAFRGRDQILTDTVTAKGVYANPLKVASGEQEGYTRDEYGNRKRVDLGLRNAQVLRAAMNKGREVHKWGSRSGRLVGDVSDVVRGKRKVDERGRPLKREWEKSYFRNMVGSAVVGAGLLGHAAAMKHSPRYRSRVRRGVGAIKEKANQAVPDLFPTFSSLHKDGRTIAFARRPDGRLIAFDWSAPDWDVRDGRGRSARVFAPGAQARDRREKKWHERVSNIRKIAIAGAVLAAGAGGAAGYKIGQTRGVKAAFRSRAKKAAATRAANVARGAAAEDAAIERFKRNPNGQ